MRSNSGKDESRNNLRDPTLRDRSNASRSNAIRSTGGARATGTSKTTEMGSGSRKSGQRGDDR